MGDKGDFRVSTLGAQDATMADIDDRGRPPGDPPDAAKVWVEKVVGSSGGGVLRPERVIDNEFVEARMKLAFPNGAKGVPEITIDAEVLEAMNSLWKQCMIVKVLGRNIAISVLNRKLRELWKPTGGMNVMDLPHQFFMVRFEKEEEYLAALTGGPWRAFGSHLMVQAWSPDFNPLRDDIITTPVWVRLLHIPVNFYHEAILFGIARGLGNPVRVDLATLRFERARFARVCVEVDLSQPLQKVVRVNGENYLVAYEGLPNVCSGCGVYGHLIHNCPTRVIDQVVEKERVNDPVVPVVNQQQPSDGFTEVRRGGRKSVAPARKVVFAAGGSKSNLGRNLQDISDRSNMEIVEISNSFGKLGEDMESENMQESDKSTGMNKENEIFRSQVGQEKSDAQVKSVGPFVVGDSGNGPRDGGKFNGPPGSKRKTNKTQRPNRVGGTENSRTTTDLSSSGKRQRGEEHMVGRPGGVFVAERQEQLQDITTGSQEVGDGLQLAIVEQATYEMVGIQREALAPETELTIT